jgi:hypothetical protein
MFDSPKQATVLVYETEFESKLKAFQTAIRKSLTAAAVEPAKPAS